ncbi:MAG TPA: hypothetical protein VHX44_18785, partial [Planctomycetota bacterium]|nr:hypothetical protein [Planctomycetota bacterium]
MADAAHIPRRSPTLVRQRSRRRVWWLVGTVTATLLAAEAITIALLLGVVEDEGRERLETTARHLGDLVEAVARFDAVFSKQDHPQGSAGATLSQIADALRATGTEDVEIVVARQDTSGITIVLSRHLGGNPPIPANAPAAAPFVAALGGTTGLMQAVDPAGRAMWCAYRPLPTLKMALVVQQTVAEMRAPVFHAGSIAALVTMMLGGVGVLLLLRQTNPLLDELSSQAEANRA